MNNWIEIVSKRTKKTLYGTVDAEALAKGYLRVLVPWRHTDNMIVYTSFKEKDIERHRFVSEREIFKLQLAGLDLKRQQYDEDD